MFGFVLYDKKKDFFLAARDPIGIIPLYIGWGRDGSVWLASELKALKVQAAARFLPPFEFCLVVGRRELPPSRSTPPWA